MNRISLVFSVVLAMAGTAVAVDVQLRDGTVINAESYRVTGSYVMLKLANGSQVAYDVADVDVDALLAAEAARAAAAGEQPAAQKEAPKETISSGRALKSADEAADDQSRGLAITDRDVKHVRGSGVLGEEEEENADAAVPEGIPEGYREGGSVVLNSLRVEPAGEGMWRVQGEVVNRDPAPVLNVSVKLETVPPPGGEKWSSEVSVASMLGPDEKGIFDHGFAAEVEEGSTRPSVRATVVWMQEETRRVPDYSKAGGVPHPSNLPLQFGGVSGADVRPTPVQ